MKKIVKMMALLSLLSGLFGIVATRTPEVKAEAATTQTQRRVYVYLEGAWDNAGRMFIYYWGGTTGTTWASCPEMTKVVSDYWQGLFFYDVPIDVTAFLVKDSTGNVSKNSNQSDDIAISSLFPITDYKVAAVKGWVSDDAKRAVVAADNAPVSSLQAAAILNNINSCSTSYASGFNAWPQLNDLFISPSTLVGSTVVTDNFGGDTTITNKTAWLQAKYSLDGGSSSQRIFDTPQNNVMAVAIIGVLGVSAIAGYYFLKTKKAI